MTEKLHCYENALAERVNGILKQEYGLGEKFNTKKAGIACFNQAVYLYNERRPHMSIDYRTPSELHDMSCNEAARLRLAPSSALRAACEDGCRLAESSYWSGAEYAN